MLDLKRNGVQRKTPDRAGAVHLVMRMLGREGEDFSFVNLDGEMTKVEAWIEWPRMPGDPGRARVDKPDRIRQFDGTETVVYFPERDEAYRFEASGVNLELFWPEGLRGIAPDIGRSYSS